VPDRVTYAVDKDIVDQAESVQACAAVLAVLAPSVRSASVEPRSNASVRLPEEVQIAERRLKAIAEHQGHEFALVDADDPAWRAVEVYAAWALNAELLGDDGEELASFHDCGYSVVADLTGDEAVELRGRIAPIADLTELNVVHERRREAKSQRRRAALRRVVARLRPRVR
jgi:hypothetical protein